MPDESSVATVREVVGLLLELSSRIGQNFVARAAEFGLSAAEAKVLMAVHAGDPRPMRAVARKLGYDASNLTGVVDRLEDRGLLVRRADAADRRVKAVAVTPDGARLVAGLTARLHSDPGPLGVLDPHELADLHRLLRLAVTREGPT